MSNSICVSENKKPLRVLAFSYFHEKGNTPPLASAGSEGIVRFRRLQEGKGGLLEAAFSASVRGQRPLCNPGGQLWHWDS